MTHRFSIKEISAQAGLSTATVDRVLNDRAHVSAQTRARVLAAIGELETQEQQLAARGRRLFFDVVVEAPERFSREVRWATEHVLPSFSPLNLRARFEGGEILGGRAITSILDRIAKRGSHGVCLKARDIPEVKDGIERLRARGIPVVTLVTDVPETPRLAYAGLDNEQAGRTAAALLKRELPTGRVLGTISNRAFQGEDARWAAFSRALGSNYELELIRDAAGLNTITGLSVQSRMSAGYRPDAIYSMSGGNRAICAALERFECMPKLYLAHDLDSDNLGLLQSGRITHVLYHDLVADMSQVFRHLCAYHRVVPSPNSQEISDIQIVMQSNIPKRALGK